MEIDKPRHCIYNVDTLIRVEWNEGGKFLRAALSKWGNSLAVRIPKALADSARLREGEAVELKSLRKGEILIRRRRTLEQMVTAITPENRHAATEWGPPGGKELW